MNRIRHLAAALLSLFLVATGASRADAQPLVADLSSHLIAITTGFAGTEILLYGATEGEGDVAVVVRGPDASTVVRRKSRIAGIWINREQMTFTGVPAFYRVATSRPLGEIAAPPLLTRYQIGVEHLRLPPAAGAAPGETTDFRAGLIRNKERLGLYSTEVGKVNFLGTRLFRTRIGLPANVPTGSYTVEVFLIRNGQVIAAQTTPMFVSKIGIGADVFEFAHRQAAIYGILAIAIAVLAGWGAGAIFRKG